LPVLIGCSGWSYADSFKRAGWVKVFYPDTITDTNTKRLPYYSQYFDGEELGYMNLLLITGSILIRNG